MTAIFIARSPTSYLRRLANLGFIWVSPLIVRANLCYYICMERFGSIFGEIELTDEREEHIFEHHPEISIHRRQFSETLLKPDLIKRSKYDTKVLIFYRKLRKQYLAVVIKTNQRHFILTAYITSKIIN